VAYTGLTVADTQDDGWTTCLHPDDVDPAVTAWQEAKAHGTPYEVAHRVRGVDGRYRRFLSRAAPLYDAQGQLLQWFGTYTDLEERQQAEDALHEAQAALAYATPLTMLGELTASIALEVNQPLGAIVTNGQACLRLLAREALDLQKARDVIERIVGDGLRASDVIRRLRALVTRKDEEKAWLHVNEIIQDVIVLTSPELSQCEIHLQLALTADLPPVLGDWVQLQQVLLNLILNATEAMSVVGWQPRARCASPRAPVHPERSWWPCGTPARGSIRGTATVSLTPSLPRKPKGWDWGCRSVAGSSKPTADECGRRRTMALARPCVSPCPQGVPTREAWRPRRRCGSVVNSAQFCLPGIVQAWG
jgi:hypothetical protein